MPEKSITGAGLGVMVIKDKQVLLGLRHADPTKADSELHGEGTWTMPGGKIRFGENFEQTASRELTEETSLIGREFKLISLATDKVPDAHFITMGMLCTDFSGQVKTMEPDEIVEWRWFALDNLPAKMFPASRTVAENYLNGTIYQPTE